MFWWNGLVFFEKEKKLNFLYKRNVEISHRKYKANKFQTEHLCILISVSYTYKHPKWATLNFANLFILNNYCFVKFYFCSKIFSQPHAFVELRSITFNLFTLSEKRLVFFLGLFYTVDNFIVLSLAAMFLKFYFGACSTYSNETKMKEAKKKTITVF